MPTIEEALAELYSRGKLTPDQLAAYEELARRGRINLPAVEEPKSSGVSSRVPECYPDYLCIFISQCTFRYLPDNIRYCAGLIKYN